MTIGDQERKIRKQSLAMEITNLKKEVAAIRNNDPDSLESDPDVEAYRKVIAKKESEYERM